MNDWAAKRFWKTVSVHRAEAAWEIHLDERALKTPAKADFTLPTQALASAIAAEWSDQNETIDPGAMPLTRMANSAIDKVRTQKTAVIDMLAEYGATDLLCYRAETPTELRARQAEAWDPLLKWAKDVLGAPLKSTIGVMHVDQHASSLEHLKTEFEKFDSFQIAAFHDLVTLSGSLIIGLAVVKSDISATSLWQAAQVDEIWQQECWGADEEASEALKLKEEAFLLAARFLKLLEA